MRPRFTLACAEYDRTQRIIDGTIKFDGFDAEVVALPAEQMFARAFGRAEFDITELSFSNFMAQTARGNAPYIGIPVFPSRTFRHAAIYIRTDRIKTPHDLKGRTIGVREYSNTATLVVKGMIADEYAVEARDIHWRVGDVDRAERNVIPVPELPEGFDVSAVAAGHLLSDMLRAGDLDALISYHPPACFGTAASVARLFPRYADAERDYYARTRIFPIMHLVGVRKTLLDRYPELAPIVLDAFVRAKDAAIASLDTISSLKVAVPWIGDELLRTRSLMGEDYWPYGVEANRAAIESLVRYSYTQGLIQRPLAFDDLFAKSMLET